MPHTHTRTRTCSYRLSAAPDLDLNRIPNPNLDLAIDCRVVSPATLASMIYAYLDTFRCRWQAFNACKRVGAFF